MSYTVDCSHEYAVSNRVRALDSAPRIVLSFAKLCFFVRMPAYGCGIKNNVRSLQRSQARAFGIPLVPADQSAHASILRIKGLKAEVAGSEIEFLVIQGIVRNVHLAIDAFQAAIMIENRGSIVIQAPRAPLEYRCHDHHLKLAGYWSKRFGRRSGNGLSQI